MGTVVSFYGHPLPRHLRYCRSSLVVAGPAPWCKGGLPDLVGDVDPVSDLVCSFRVALSILVVASVASVLSLSVCFLYSLEQVSLLHPQVLQFFDECIDFIIVPHSTWGSPRLGLILPFFYFSFETMLMKSINPRRYKP